jgi:hypothetical protein
MNAQYPSDREHAHIYDRTFLLSEEKRNQVMELWEIQRYGIDSYSDADYVCVYGMKPAEWYRRGIRLLARTTVECVRDTLGQLIGKDVASVVQNVSPPTKLIIIDPFAGSCNSLYWLLHHVRDAKGIAFELDQSIFQITKQNIRFLDREIELINGDYKSLLVNYKFPPEYLMIVFVAPPWGDAMNALTGLDLRRTKPPITDIIDDFERVYKDNPTLYVTQVHQSVDPQSLEDLKQRFDWSELRIYDINIEGMKHGVLLGTSRWSPSPPGARAQPSPLRSGRLDRYSGDFE